MAASHGRTSFTGASEANSNIALWRPPLLSADADVLRDAATLRSRARDLERNHPYAVQAVRASRNGVIGRRLRYSCRPDWRYLGIDHDEAIRWGQEWERVWESYAHGTQFFVDAGRQLDFTQMMGLIHDREFVDGDSLVVAEWNPNRLWRTCFQVVDVDRLMNPAGAPDTPYLRGGVSIDEFGAPLGYCVREAHPADVGTGRARSIASRFVRRETDWGRPVGMLVYEKTRPGQTRGTTSFASVMTAMKMGAEYVETALHQQILQASYAAVLVSNTNYKEALEVIGSLPADEAKGVIDLAEENLVAAMEHHESVKLRFAGSQIPILFPGQDLKLIQPGNGAATLGEFQSQATKSYAAGTGTNSIDVSQNWSDVNFSSARMASASAYRTYEARRERLISNVGMAMVGGVLEEAVFSGAMKLPRGLDPGNFYAARDALIRGTFITQGAPMLDPVKEREAQKLGREIGVVTLQDIAADEGVDYVDLMAQLAREKQQLLEFGLTPPGPPQGGAQPGSQHQGAPQ